MFIQCSYIPVPSFYAVRGVSGYSSDKSFLYLCENLLECSLSRLALIDPTAKFMFIFKDVEKDLVEMVFAQAWKSHKMLRLIMIDTVKRCYYLYSPFKNETSTFDITTLIDFTAHHTARLKNLHKYPLRINIFTNFVYCKVSDDLTKFSLICGEIASSIEKYMNATMVYVEPADGRDFGAIGNGRMSGGIKEVEEQRVDISVTIRGVAFFYNTTQLMMLPTITIMKCSFVVPNEFYPPEIKILPYEFFDKFTVMLIGISFAILLFLTYILMYLSTDSASKLGLKQLFFTYFAIAVNSTVSDMPNNHVFRTMVASVFFVFLIINSTYQGLIITALNLSKGQNLQTIAELLDHNLTIFIPINLERLIHEYHVFPLTSVPRRLYDKAIITQKVDSRPQADIVASKRNAAVLVPHFYFHAYMTSHLDQNTGKSFLYELPEVPYQYHMSAVTQRNSPYIEPFGNVLLRLADSGLINHQINVGKSELNMAYLELAKKKLLQETKIRLISMNELLVLFMGYGIMLGFSIFVFFIELMVQCSCIKKICEQARFIKVLKGIHLNDAPHSADVKNTRNLSR